MTELIVFCSVNLILIIIGLIGIIKEKKWIVIAIAHLELFGFITNLALTAHIISAIINCALTVLTAYYAYLIFKKETQNFTVYSLL